MGRSLRMNWRAVSATGWLQVAAVMMSIVVGASTTVCATPPAIPAGRDNRYRTYDVGP